MDRLNVDVTNVDMTNDTQARVMNTLGAKKKSLLSPLSIESSPGSEKGGGGQQRMPELLNEAFSAKAT
jgi:hypothetical protein